MEAGTQFTCFTSTKVHLLTQKVLPDFLASQVYVSRMRITGALSLHSLIALWQVHTSVCGLKLLVYAALSYALSLHSLIALWQVRRCRRYDEDLHAKGGAKLNLSLCS